MEWSMPSDSGYLLKSLTFSSPFSSKSRLGTCGFRESQATHLPPGIPSKRCSSCVSFFPSQRFSDGVIIFSGWLMKLNQWHKDNCSSRRNPATRSVGCRKLKNCMPWDRSGCWSPTGMYSVTQHCREMPGYVLLVWLLSIPRRPCSFQNCKECAVSDSLGAPPLLSMAAFGSRNYFWVGPSKGLLPEKKVGFSKIICSLSSLPYFK